MIASLEEIAADVDGVGLDSAGVRKLAAVAGHDRAVLGEVTEPRLLTGDLWTVNRLLDADAEEPMITGVLEFDRTLFGDARADWTIQMATAKRDEREAFWDSPDPPPRGFVMPDWVERVAAFEETRHARPGCLPGVVGRR